MWLVVFKQDYYPSVFQCNTEDEARKLFQKIKKQENDLEDSNLYIAEVKESVGNMDENVDWYLYV